MDNDVGSKSVSAIVKLLTACASQKGLSKGAKLHAYIREHKCLEENPFVVNSLVSMYAKCGAISKAVEVFEELPVRDWITWTALIAVYSQRGQGKEALQCYDSMQYEGHCPDGVTFTCALKACSSIGAAAKGEQIHHKIASLGILETDMVVGNTLVDMYVKFGALAKAQQVLEELSSRDVVTWSILISGHAEQGHGQEALKCFDNMQCEGHVPNAVTFISALRACRTIGAADKGEQINSKIVNLDMLKKSDSLCNALVDMYVKCGALAKAQQVLEELPIWDEVTWNTLIAGYAHNGHGEEALKCYDSMQHEGHSPGAVTFICALKACTLVGVVDKGEQIHEKIISLGLLKNNIVLDTTLVDMYAKCGALAKALEVLKELPLQNVVMWSALMAGYAQQGQGEEALKCYNDMQFKGHSPDVVTFTCALKACGSIGAVTKGEQIHHQIVSLGLLEKDVMLGNTVVDMYAKCGALTKALKVLKELPFQDLLSWNALIGGFSQQGQCLEVLNCFESMQSEGMKPDSTTLICVLNACSHSGLLDQVEICVSGMSTKYCVEPDIEHYCCMVDLFSRAGEFNKALKVIKRMPSDEYLPLWVALLGACRKWGEVNIGRLAFERAVHVDRSYGPLYLCMANIYAAAGMQEDAYKIEVMRVTNKACKISGRCDELMTPKECNLHEISTNQTHL